jgi:hypothetical protein
MLGIAFADNALNSGNFLDPLTRSPIGSTFICHGSLRTWTKRWMFLIYVWRGILRDIEYQTLGFSKATRQAQA